MAALAAAAVVAAVADVATSRGAWRTLLLPVAWAATLALSVALVQGAAMAAAFAFVRRMPRGGKWLVWPAVGAGVGAWLARELGAFSRLGGKDHSLAVAALVASGVGCIGLGIVAALVQPDVGRPRGAIAASRHRGLLLLGLGAAAIGCVWADRNVVVGKYPVGHAALETASLWLVAGALVTAGVRLGPRPLLGGRLVRSLVFVAVALVPFLTLHERHQAQIHAMLDRPFSRLMLGWARDLTDVDRDGFSAMLGGGDCNDLDGSVSPAAAEIANNGVDDNCMLGDAPRVGRHVDAARVAVPTKPSPVSVVLITIDTLRADHLSLYGYSRDTTPSLARLAKRSALFDRAYTSGGWTSVAVSSLMRGLYPRHMLWTRLVETSSYRLVRFGTQLPPGETFRLGFALPLEDPLAPLPVWLQRRGMYTVAVVDDGYSEFLSADHMGRGFDRYVEVNPAGTAAAKDDQATAEAAIEAINAAPTDKPFFLWVHFFGPHEPNTPHPHVPDFGPIEADKYDHEIRFADQQVARVIGAADRRGAERPVAMVVASDHGEIIRNDHDRDHGSDLRPEILRIPLIVKAPSVAVGKVDVPVSLVDVMPTILALTETPGPTGLDGIDLRRAVRRDPSVAKRLLLVDTWRFGPRGTVTVDQAGVIDGEYALVRDRRQNLLVLRALASASSTDQPNLFGSVPSAALEEALARYQEDTGGAIPLASGAGALVPLKP